MERGVYAAETLDIQIVMVLRTVRGRAGAAAAA
jgi:hypothetical protein